MLEPYRPQDYRQVRAFARRLENFFYVRHIIRWHTKENSPGQCYVWREGGRIAAFSAVAYLNPDDAFLWGMRVDPKFKNRGIATEFTTALFPLIRKTGRTWAGLNTLDRARPAPTFRVMDKLGMKLHAIDAVDVFFRMPGRLARPRPRRMKGIFNHCLAAGHTTFFHQGPGWLWSRLLPGRRKWFNEGGRLVCGTPVRITAPAGRKTSGFGASTAVNILDRPPDWEPLLSKLLGYGSGRGRAVVLCYPAQRKREVRAAARRLVPNLKRNRNCWTSAWRVYGKRL